jgi:intracellular septation protein
MSVNAEPASAAKHSPQPHSNERPIAKLLIELGPLLVFFAAYAKFGIRPATAVLMAATLISLVASRVVLRKISPMPIVTAVLVVVFGSLTLWLDDPRFIKMKPTAVYLLFAGALTFGVATGRPLLKMMLGEAFHLTAEGWRQFTLRWIIFFCCLALLNEIVWRNFSEGTWVTFKTFGVLPLTILFTALQIGLIRRFSVVPTIDKTSG